MAEQKISQIVFEDELGNKVNIPLEGIKPIVPALDTFAKMEPYRIQGKDWSIAITKLEFRLGTKNTAKKMASIHIAFSNNLGPDNAFLPKEKY